MEGKYIMSIITNLYITCGVIYIIIGSVTLYNDLNNKLNKLFFVMCINLSFWALMFALRNRSLDATTASIFHLYSTFSWSIAHCLLLNFIMGLTHNGAFFKNKLNYLFFYSPAIFSSCLYFLEPLTAHNFVKVNFGWAIMSPMDRGFVWTHFFNLYYFSYMIAVIFLLFRWLKNSKMIRERKQAKLILITVFVAIVAGSITDIVLPTLGIPLIPSLGIVFVMMPMMGIWYSINKYKLMNLNPENFALEVLKIMNEGLIIVDYEGIIQDINYGALKLLGYKKDELINRAVTILLSDLSDVSKLTNCSSLEINIVKSNNEKLPILLSSSILQDEWGDSLGIVGIFQDISEIKLVQNKLIKSYDELEIKVVERTSELSLANKELEHEICVRIKMEEKIKILAYYDHLTGLPNRRLFNDRLNQCIIDAALIKKTLGVLFLDLDSFKRINDTMGHTKGDELLKMVSKKLISTLREGDTVCRVGGDEFLILVKNLEEEHYIEELSEKILDIFKEPFTISNHEFFMTTSIGGAIYPIDGTDTETLIKNADIAMYKAKEEGKNKYRICTELIKNRAFEEMKLTNSLYHSLEQNELELYYQPQVSAMTGEKLIQGRMY